MYIPPDLLLWKGYFFFLGTFDDQFQISFFGPFHSDEKFVQFIVYKPVQILDNVIVI